MKIQNISTNTITISDLRHHKGSIGCVILPGQTLTVYDDDAEKSVGLAALRLASPAVITVSEDPRGSLTSLDGRLSVATNADGTLKTALRVDVKEGGTLKVTDPDTLNFVNATVSESPSGTALITINGASTGTTSNTYTVDSDSTTGKIIVDVALGSTDNTLTITNNALTGNRIATFQNVSGTVAYVADIATDANLSSAAQAAVTATHGVNDVSTGTLAKLVSYTSAAAGAGAGPLALVCTGVKLADTLLVAWNSTVGVTPANSILVALTVSADDQVTATWNGDQGGGAKVTVYVKKA